MRGCAHCGTSLDGYRSDARYCGAGHRAAAGRNRAAERAEASPPNSLVALSVEAPQSRAEACIERLATMGEERELTRARRKLIAWERTA
jgi:hypothetical protein